MENEAAHLRRKLSSVREENSSLVLENRQLISDLEAAQLEISSSKSKVPHISRFNPSTPRHTVVKFLFKQEVGGIL